MVSDDRRMSPPSTESVESDPKEDLPLELMKEYVLKDPRQVQVGMAS